MKLSNAERQVVELLRTREPFGLSVIAINGEFAVTTTADPAAGTHVCVGIGPDFERAWQGRRNYPGQQPQN